MRLKAGQLSSSLKRNALAPLYLVSGEEPLQLMECVDQIRRHARQQGHTERVVFTVEPGFDWNTLPEETATASLFAPKRLVELRMGDSSPGKDGGAVLAQYAENPPADTVLIISAGKIDKQAQQSKWFSALDRAGVVVQVWPLVPEELPEWIGQRLAARGRSIDPQALVLLADQVEGNLLAAIQEIDKLCLLTDNEKISVVDVGNSVSDNARYEVFALLEAAMAGDAKRCARMLSGLRVEGLKPGEILRPLLWDFRRVCSIAVEAASGAPLNRLFSEYRVWNEQRKQSISLILRRCKPQQLHALLIQALRLERMVKSSDQVMAWQALLGLLLAIAGKPLMSHAETPV
ncbi:MAG: DNA polymerase III subunit delta [Gammaproteobacteria bacterium]